MLLTQARLVSQSRDRRVRGGLRRPLFGAGSPRPDTEVGHLSWRRDSGRDARRRSQRRTRRIRAVRQFALAHRRQGRAAHAASGARDSIFRRLQSQARFQWRRGQARFFRGRSLHHDHRLSAARRLDRGHCEGSQRRQRRHGVRRRPAGRLSPSERGMMRRLILALALCLAAAPAFAARIKDISVLRSARDTQLVGYGLVVGLQGSGDTLRNAPFTEQSVQAMLTHLGLDVHGASLRNRNVASVIVTADLSAGVETATRVDVTVSALGDAPSLMGGTLLLTQLQAADGTVYASAQGAVSVTGFDAVGQGETTIARRADRRPHSEWRDRRTRAPRLRGRIALDARIEKPRLRDGGQDCRRDQRLFPRAVPRERRLRGRQPEGRIVSPPQDLVRSVHGRNWRASGCPGHGRTRRSRRADRHGRRRPGRADFNRRGNLRNADGSGRRAAPRLAAGPVLERQNGRHARHAN